MLTYEYTAVKNEGGDIVKAEVQAESEKAAAKLLMAQNMFPVTIDEKGKTGLLEKAGLVSRVSPKERIILTRQLSTLINAGLPLTQSLRMVADQIQSKTLKDMVAQVVSSVEGGTSLSESLAKFPSVFNDVFVSLVAAGEASGSLDKALERIANQQEKDDAILRKVRGALIYPVIVLVVIVLMLVFMLTTVLPQVGSLYKDLGQQLPLITRILLDISAVVVHLWFLVAIAVGAGVMALRSYIKTEAGRAIADRAKMNLPIFGRIFRKMYMARFSRTLGTMLESGIPMLEALRIVKHAVANVHVEATIERSMQGVKGGKALSSTLENQSTFTELVPQMIRIGEHSGAIDSMLDRVATYYEAEVDEEIKNLSTTMEPLLMVILGVVVGGVIAAVLLPVYGLVGSGGVNNLH